MASVFRVARTDLEFNGFLIPKGEKICWNLNNGNKAESLYPEPAKWDINVGNPLIFSFVHWLDMALICSIGGHSGGLVHTCFLSHCYFEVMRYIDIIPHRTSAIRFCPFRFLHGGDDQPRPSLFGFGRHICPGRELAKFEIVMFFKTFLRKYKYRLAKKQVR